MSRGGLRPRKSDGSIDHLIKSKWRLGKTCTIRVPIKLTEQLLEIAHRLDKSELSDLSQDNKMQDLNARSDLSQDNKIKIRALLQTAITPKSKGGSYAANNATGMKKLIEQALDLLNEF